jgi:hypothetical protein
MNEFVNLIRKAGIHAFLMLEDRGIEGVLDD